MPRAKPPHKPRHRRRGKPSVRKRANAAVVEFATKRSRLSPKTRQDTTAVSIADLSVGVEYLLPKLDDD